MVGEEAAGSGVWTGENGYVCVNLFVAHHRLKFPKKLLIYSAFFACS